MTSSNAVLIVDTDPKGLESLVYGFQGADWRITACPSPETASLLIKAAAAQLVVIASRTEHERMHSLIRQLRAKEVWRSLPLLVLGPEELRPTLVEHGNVDLLTMPAFVRDVLTASELLVTAGPAAAQRPGDEPSFRAPITSALTLSLVRSMNGLVRSGHLRLERNGRTGEILFHQGELTAASVGPLQAMAAVQHLMVWNDGNLELRLRQVPKRGQLHLSAQEFLQEIDRFERDYAHAMRELGPATTAYAASQERLNQAGDSIPAEVTPVVRLCDGRRALCDVIDESPFRVLDTVRILARLAELGVLTRADGRKLPSALGAHTADEEFLDTARIVGPTRAWPMPAPIGGFPTPPPAPAAPLPEPAPGSGSLAGAVPQSVTPPPGDRPRRQTREIGVPATTAGQPSPLISAVPPVAPPVAAAPTVARSAANPAIAAPVAPVATKRGTPVTPGPRASSDTPVTPAPVAASRPAGAAATLVQVSGGTGKPPPSSAKPEPPEAPASGTIPNRPQAVPLAQVAAPSPTQAPPPAPLHASGAVTPRPIAPAVATANAPGAAPPPSAAASGAIVHRLASPPTGPNAIAGATQVGGVIESRKAGRRSQQNLRAVGEQPRVVIDTLASEREGVKTPPPVSSSSGNLPRTSATAPAGEPTAGGQGARITGVLETVPSRRGASPSTPPPPARIQLDASLSEPVAVKPAAPASASPAPGTRVTGELHTVPSGRSTRPMATAASAPSSFHIDPSLTANADPGARTPAPRRTDSQPTPGLKRRASGGFSSVETDFFEREAELYKEEKPESFADLDAEKRKRRPGGKPGRANRR